ncbi:MAG: helicase-related protein [Blastocatellia bacterium]
MAKKISNLKQTMYETFGAGQFHPAGLSDLNIYRPNLHYEVVRVSSDSEKQLPLVRLLRENEGAGVIHTATIRAAQTVTDYLKQLGFEVAPYHSRLSAREREGNLARFMAGGFKAIVVADEFEIDKPDIGFVIHYDAPNSLKTYFRESGRAGRDGREARCALLFQPVDRRTQLFFLGGRYPTPGDAIPVYEALERLKAEESPAPLELIQESASGVAKTKVRVILSLLKDANLVKEHRGARYKLLATGLSASEIEQMADQSRNRSECDQEELERMAFYGRSPECRWRLLLDYFGENAEMTMCGHCDNCLRPLAEHLATTESAANPDFVRMLFTFDQQKNEEGIRPGDVVRLPAHGEVKVKAVEGDKIVVSFPDGETRKFKQEWVIR